MVKIFEYKEFAGSYSGSAFYHEHYTKQWDRKRISVINEEHDINIKCKYELIVHNKLDSHTLVSIFTAEKEADLVAFKLLWR